MDRQNAFSATMFGALTLVAGGLTTAFTTVNKIQNDEKRKEEERDLSLSYIFAGVDSRLVQISKAKLEREPVLQKLLDQLGGIQKQLGVVAATETEVRNLVDREIYELEKAGKNPEEIEDLKAVDPGAKAFLFALGMPEGKEGIEFRLKGKHRATLSMGSVLLLRGREILSADWSLVPHEDAIQVQILAMFCRDKRDSDDKNPEESVEPSPTEESTTATSAPTNGRTSTPSPSESPGDQSDHGTSDVDSDPEGQNGQCQDGVQETNGHANGEVEKTGCPEENGNGPLPTSNGHASGRQSPPDNASESRAARVDSPTATTGQTIENAELREPPANDGGVGRKRRRKAKGKGNFPTADGQSPSGLQEPQGDSSRPRGKGRRNGYRRAKNGGAVDKTGNRC